MSNCVIGNWALGTGDWVLGAGLNLSQSLVPSPQSLFPKSKTMLNTPPNCYRVGYFILKGVCHNY